MMFEIAVNPTMSLISLRDIWSLGYVILSLSCVIYYWRTLTIRFPASIPWVGVRNEAFSKSRAWIREFTAGLGTVHDGYHTHNEKGKPFILLDTAGRRNLILPKESIRWLVDQPEEVLDSHKLIYSKFALKYLIPPIRPVLLQGLVIAIRRDVTRNLGRTQKGSFDTIRELTDRHMGLQQSWHEVNLPVVVHDVIAGVSYRMLVGNTLYHNEDFMKALYDFGNLLGIGSLLIGQFTPFFMAPLVGLPASFLVSFFRRKALKYLIPEIQQRMDLIKQDKADPNSSFEPPLDIVHWSIMLCPDGTAAEMAELILSLTLGATHSSINVATVTMLDLLSSPAEMGYFEAIALEAASVFQNEEDFADLASLQKLSRVDSAIRESSRRNPLTGRGIMREVVHKNGVTLPDGQKIPHGAWLGVSLTGIHQDERYYSDPLKYDPFRFSRARTEVALIGENKNTNSPDQAVGEQTGEDDSTEEVSEKSNVTIHKKPNGSWLSTAQEEFGIFGYGRRSCPGRWFASHVIKMTIAYIALNYEIEEIKNRPSDMVIADVIVPAQSLKVMVRRKKLT